MIKLEVLLFAQPRELAGTDRVSVELPAGSTWAELKDDLVRRYPGLGPLVAVSRLAVDGEFVDQAAKIVEGKEVALVPPVSGG